MPDFTVTTALVAVGAAVAALLVLGLLVALVRSRRRGRGDREQVLALVSELHARVETISREVSEALERAKEEGRRNRFLGELGASIDLDEVLARTLEAGGAIPGVDAALVSIRDGAAPIVATMGLSAAEAQRQAISGPPNGHEARAISIAYQYAPGLDAAELIHSGLAVPVRGDADAIGFVAVYSRSRSHRFEEETIRELEELAKRAGPAIENARRFREARQLADLDALTGLHNRRYFHETLAREVARAHRYGRQLALIVFDLDDFKSINDRVGHLAGDAVLAEIAQRVRDVVRSADVPCRVGGDEFAVILPESSSSDGDLLYRRLLAAVSSQPFGQAGRLLLSAGIAELQADDDPTTFFERTDEALYRAKELGKGQVYEAENAGLAVAREASRRPGTASSR
ncbi:MAG TPA: GGDEF domain-containing protein [Gaiellaceae bacterium]|nr:GGDEF domain-containing protein [Gaiellaceae bacterium]